MRRRESVSLSFYSFSATLGGVVFLKRVSICEMIVNATPKWFRVAKPEGRWVLARRQGCSTVSELQVVERKIHSLDSICREFVDGAATILQEECWTSSANDATRSGV